MGERINTVLVIGKITQSGKVRYTAAGEPVRSYTLAVPQERLGKKSVGNYSVWLSGSLAESHGGLRVGETVAIRGRLWTRDYRNRRGEPMKETLIIAEKLGPTVESV